MLPRNETSPLLPKTVVVVGEQIVCSAADMEGSYCQLDDESSHQEQDSFSSLDISDDKSTSRMHRPTLGERALLATVWTLVFLTVGVTMGACHSVLKWQNSMAGLSSSSPSPPPQFLTTSELGHFP